VLQHLEQYRHPDTVFLWEEALLQALSFLHLAEDAISAGKGPYALELLEKAGTAGDQTPYYTAELERRRLLALAQLVPTELPTDDRELLLRADGALKRGNAEEAVRYLEAAQLRSGAYWNYLRGRAYMEIGDYDNAQICLKAAWDHDPKTCAALLEQCCRELDDYKGAYHYACLLREM
jgi:tetratricopeptide (TPR) repeat protein